MPTLEEIKKDPRYAANLKRAQERPIASRGNEPFKLNFMSWMDRLMRPAYASAGVAKELIAPGEEFEPGKAIWKGLTGEEKTLYSDVLQTAGWKPTTKIGKFARGVTGFGLDVLLDPMTYVGVGALTKAGRVASRSSKLAATLPAQAQAGQRALISFMGKPIVKGAPILAKAGQAGMALRQARGIGTGIEKFGKAFVPGFRPRGVDPNKWNQLLSIKRKATSIQKIGNERAFEFATGVLDDIKRLAKTGKIDDAGMGNLITAIEKRGMATGLPKSVRPIYDKLIKHADDIALRRKGIGKFLLDDSDYNYWLHNLSDAERQRLKRTGMDITLKDWTTHSASDVHRQYVKVAGQVKRVPLSQQKILAKQGIKIEQATIGEINKSLGREFFSTDIPFTSFQMGKRVARQEGGMEFFKGVRELGSPEAIEGWVKSTAPELKGLHFNPQIAKEIDSLKQVFVGKDISSEFGKVFDSVQGYWKKQTLGPFPAYHFRNMVGNTWNNYLAGVTNPARYTRAASIQRKVASGVPLTGWEKQIVERAQALGVLERGWFGTVLGMEGAPRYYKPPRTLGKKIADIGLIPAEKGLRVGRHIENNARLAHFIDKVGKGWGFDEAALSVKKYLFDYTELTPFEANTMRRLMPFYTWSRKNIPLQIQHIAKTPGKTAGLVEKARLELAGGAEPERKFLPEWLRERYPFRVGKPEKGVARYFPLESWLPIADVGKLARPGQAASELLSPGIKLPIELAMNRSFYFEQPIRKYLGERKKLLGIPFPAKTEYALRNVRILNELNRLFEKSRPTAFEATKIDKAVRALTGIKAYPQRIKEMKNWAKYNVDKQVFELKKGYNRARRNKDFKEARRINQIIKKLEAVE